MGENRWNKCIAHYDDDVKSFFHEYFADESKACLLIGGAGFDPRSTELVRYLSGILGERLVTHLIREERPDPDLELVRRAENNLGRIEAFCQKLEVTSIDIFAEDNAVVGGRNVISAISNLRVSEYSDIVIDMSALSIGISFPVVSYIYGLVRGEGSNINVHLSVLSNPELDVLISSAPNDRASDVRGFDQKELFGDSDRARLWLPQLSEGKQHILSLIYTEVAPHDTCPILPFPSEDPKKGDRIACSLISSLENEWNVDPRNFVYADERKPLDIYRTILRIDDERKPVFETFGGSVVILSPLGSKIPAIGALMAALERNFPVVYVESLAYNVDWDAVNALESTNSRMAHIWLCGDAYLNET